MNPLSRHDQEEIVLATLSTGKVDRALLLQVERHASAKCALLAKAILWCHERGFAVSAQSIATPLRAWGYCDRPSIARRRKPEAPLPPFRKRPLTPEPDRAKLPA